MVVAAVVVIVAVVVAAAAVVGATAAVVVLKGKGKGIWFIVLYPPKCSHNLPPLAGLYTQKPFQSPRDIPEQLAAYSAQALSTALSMLGTHFAAG